MKEIHWLADSLGKVFDHLKQPATIVDAGGVFVYYNRASARMDGVDPKSIIGRHVLEVSPWLKAEDSTLLRCVEDGQRFVDNYQAYSGAGGELLHYVHSAQPLTGRDGTIIGAIEIGRIERPPETRGRAEKAPEIVGEHPALTAQLDAVDTFAACELPILIHGETGTGKELFARRAHAASPRAHLPMLCLNCAAVPENLIESTLFGTTRGAFTGAENRKGLFSLADGGTLFLDEINSMPIALQSKLLRVLQDGSFLPLGAEKPLRTDVRLIAALNQPPLAAVRDGRLREDLYYRLNVGVVAIPPLRKRASDVALLARRFVARYAPQLNPQVTSIGQHALDELMAHDWPGNVRELENVIRRSLLLARDQGSVLARLYFNEDALPSPGPLPAALAPVRHDTEGLREQLARFEGHLLQGALAEHAGNLSAAARALKLPRTTLISRLSRLGLATDTSADGQAASGSPKWHAPPPESNR